MKIPIIITTPQWSLNGVNVFCADLARGLMAAGWPVQILITHPDAPDSKPLPLDTALPFHFLPVQKQMSWRKRWQLLQAHLTAAAPCIYLPNHDRWHACISPTLPSNVGIVGIIHSDEPAYYEQVQRLGDFWQRIVVVSAQIQQKMRHDRPDLSDKLRVIPYGVPLPDQAVVRHSAETIRIIYAGRLDKQQKRVDWLPQIAATLRANALPFQMTIVGNGAAAADLKATCAAFDDVQIIDTLTPTEMRALYAKHDLFLLPSRYEGLPIALLEAMAQGCVPLVSHVHSGVADIIQHEKNGLLIPVDDMMQFSVAITRLQQQFPWRVQLAQHAYTTICEQFSVQRMVQAYAGLFMEVSAEIMSSRTPRSNDSILPPPEFSWKHRLPYYIRHYAVATKHKLQGKYI